MAKCPKCGRHLKLTDWHPNCPGCGTNLVYYNMEENLMNEADAAELEHAHLQKRIDRLKASFVGSPLAIARIFISLLPIGMLMLPLCSVSFSGPLIEMTTKKINAIEIYNLVSSLDFDAVFTMMGSKLVGSSFTAYFVSLAAILLSLVFVVLSLVFLVASYGPKGKPRNIILNCLAIVAAVVSAISFTKFASGINAAFPEFVSGKLEFGVILYFVALLVLLVTNIIFAKKAAEVKYKQCYVGGIPAEEYEELVANGTDKDEIHNRMVAELAKKAAEKAEAAAKKLAEKEKEENKKSK